MIKKSEVYIALLFMMLSFKTFSQPVPPPPANHGASGNQPGGGAPIDGGVSILLLMGAIYGTKKVFQIKNKEIKNLID